MENDKIYYMQDTPNIRKKEEFEAFLDALEESSIPHWSDIAEAVGVNKDTITEWKRHPRARMAHIKGIQYALNQMELAGKNDWRMWEVKLRMLGLRKDTDKEDFADTKLEPISITYVKPDGSPADPET